ncbi:Trp operon repressor [Vibrio sp. MACH09]|uniref:trp operon repressor n=1 Tax=unclassified Vibrio TaxID=2614977 RepID=UPI0014938BFF|nr:MULTISPECIES: trp operon repressor [unclassified Vibrio]NOI67258.1 trp operon repressor [Vibrio sp. 99-8-1]GLO59980.1 Trp operon repressor [Vibrio sp. MACH09]
MSLSPEFTDWQHVIRLVKSAAEKDQHEMLLTSLLTQDERDALVARVNIFNELLKGDISQRQISQMLGVGIATITRGSNELKSHTDEEKESLFQLLVENKDILK